MGYRFAQGVRVLSGFLVTPAMPKRTVYRLLSADPVPTYTESHALALETAARLNDRGMGPVMMQAFQMDDAAVGRIPEPLWVR